MPVDAIDVIEAIEAIEVIDVDRAGLPLGARTQCRPETRLGVRTPTGRRLHPCIVPDTDIITCAERAGVKPRLSVPCGCGECFWPETNNGEWRRDRGPLGHRWRYFI